MTFHVSYIKIVFCVLGLLANSMSIASGSGMELDPDRISTSEAMFESEGSPLTPRNETEGFQITTGFVIQSLAHAYLISVLKAQSENLGEASREVGGLTESCLNELSQSSCVGMDLLSCKDLSGIQGWLQSIYGGSGVGRNWILYTGSALALALGKTAKSVMSLPGLPSFDDSLLVFAGVAAIRSMLNPIPASIPVSYLTEVPQSVLDQLATLTRDNTQVLVAATAVIGVRSYQLIHQYIVNKTKTHHDEKN